MSNTFSEEQQGRWVLSASDKLEAIERRYSSLEDTLSSPNLDGPVLIKLQKERAEISEIVEVFRAYKKATKSLEETLALLESSEPELRSLAKEEEALILEQMEIHRQKLVELLLPKDPEDHKNAILEIRAGTGGEEAGLFCADLLRMYMRYAEKRGWKLELVNSTESALGGFKEVVLFIQGDRVYGRLKVEKGVHRVQRVPSTEAQGRIHTSACTVAVLPEAEEIELEINPADLRIDTYRASGAGGQHVNRTDSAVRITHIPTGVVSECQDERSQHKNKDRAMKMLRSRLLDAMRKQKDSEVTADRRSQVGSGDRSEKIRTYNFPQGRVSDHRIQLTLHKLLDFLNGDMDQMLDALGSHFTAIRLQESGDSYS
ncbi:MAG: peptide chain release factor 1 [Oligoflexales bacterium]|nr:peptide chain release factor 1 [Oligoflexales bacterium]